MLRKKAHIALVVILFIKLMVFQSCRPAKIPANAHINNDSTAIYSTHASRPFKYGYAYTKEECKLYFDDALKNYGIKNGDVIADVGAASGWIDGGLSVFTDSVTFYVQDINIVFLNDTQLNAVVKHYSAQRESAQTNRFYLLIGTTKKTGLPYNAFDKIILNNSFHEIKNHSSILNDLYTKLKPGGKIIVQDEFSNNYKKIRHTGCRIKAYKTKRAIRIFDLSGYYLTRMAYPENSFINYLTFEKDRSGYDTFNAEKKSVKPYIDELDKLNEPAVYNDSNATITMAHYLKDNMAKIQTVYPTLEEYINSLGYQLTEQKQFIAAVNILKINTFLYPESSLTYESLGETMFKSGQLELALEYFQKSVEINSANKDAWAQINKIKLTQEKDKH